MKPLITPDAMRAMEMRFFAETGTPSIELMERAARALCDEIIRRYGTNKTLGVLCGPGGNGGDGYACARMYTLAGGKAFVVPVKAPTSSDAVVNRQRAQRTGVSERTDLRPDIWLDALYGTGLSRAPEGDSAAWIKRVNGDREAGSIVVAVDIPSGLNGLSGIAYASCIRADVTCTFQYAKPGCHMMDGLDQSGEVVTLDIGIPASFYPKDSPGLVDAEDLRAVLKPRPRNFHKGQAGHLLIVAGSFGMAGAAAMCARAALLCGAGLVTIACPREIVPVLQTLVPCAMCAAISETGEELAELLRGKTAVVCGCGLSRKASPEIIRQVLASNLPTLLDADALNIISESDELKAMFRPHHLITPHPGEATRLLGRKMTDPLEDACALYDLGCNALLKGASSVIFRGSRALISRSGSSGMAKGGSGDALSGVIGALMAQFPKTELSTLAAVGSEIHGLAGEMAQSRRGMRGMTPMDLIDCLPEVLKMFEQGGV